VQPWSALGPCRGGNHRSAAGTSGHVRHARTAGHMPIGAPIWDGRDGVKRSSSLPPNCREPFRLLPTRQWPPRTGLTLRSGRSQMARRSTQRHPRRPCHKRAIHSGPERSGADNHGQPLSRLDLRRSPSSQVTAAPDLALGAGGRCARSPMPSTGTWRSRQVAVTTARSTRCASGQRLAASSCSKTSPTLWFQPIELQGVNRPGFTGGWDP
jgi:hypothetical protein